MSFAQPLQLPVGAAAIGDYVIDRGSTMRLARIVPIYIGTTIVNYQVTLKALGPSREGKPIEVSSIFEPNAVLSCVLRGSETCCDGWLK